MIIRYLLIFGIIFTATFVAEFLFSLKRARKAKKEKAKTLTEEPQVIEIDPDKF